jgi:hypothetical protein
MNTKVRHGIAYAVLILYAIYALKNIGMSGLMFGLGVGIVAYGFDFPLELSVLLVILGGFGWKSYYQRSEDFRGAPTGDGANLTGISNRVSQLEKRNVFAPVGIMGSKFLEGFADASDNSKEGTPANSSSSPAPTDAPTATENLKKDVPTAAKASDGFTNKGTDGMFKLGSIPSDAADGAHIDVGTTLMNALNSLKPDQVKQMTEDTRKLMETQKSLMGMLGTMKPMLQDGKQMMDTFQEMFGNK